MNEQREMSGVLFKNDHKDQAAQPDYRGECKIEGKDFKISGWIKEGKTGKFFSFAFSPKEEAPKEAGGFDKPIADEIPF